MPKISHGQLGTPKVPDVLTTEESRAIDNQLNIIININIALSSIFDVLNSSHDAIKLGARQRAANFIEQAYLCFSHPTAPKTKQLFEQIEIVQMIDEKRLPEVIAKLASQISRSSFTIDTILTTLDNKDE